MQTVTRIKDFTLGLLVASIVAMGAAVVYAQVSDEESSSKWEPFWHGTNWIDDGSIIQAQEMAENLEYLKKRIDELESRIENGTTTITIRELPPGLIVAGCSNNDILTSQGLARPHLCWGGAQPQGLKSRFNYAGCPPNTRKFTIIDTYDSYTTGGDGAPSTAYRSEVQGFLCIKQ